MAKATRITLLTFTLPNKAGQLAAVSELLAGAKVSIQALNASESGATAGFSIAIKNAEKARKALAPLGTEIKEQDAVCVEMPNEAGRLLKTAKKLAEAGISVQSCWATAFGGKKAHCVFISADCVKVLTALKKKR